MSEYQPAPEAKTSQILVKHYRIRKEFMWLCVLAVMCAIGYQVNDYVRYVNWPPYELSNQVFIKSLKCKELYPPPSIQERASWESSTLRDVVDRRNYLEQPECAAGSFFVYEGNPVRHSFDIVDTLRKKRTARVVITFN